MPIDKIFGYMNHKHPISDISGVGAIATENLLAYGVQWNNTQSGSACTRVGNLALHVTLPVQSKIRRCVLQDNGNVAYYLHPDDSTKKQNGTTANLDGTDGQVMVEFPEYYAKFINDGDIHRLMISEFALPGYSLIPKMYMGAFEASLHWGTNKLSSVVNSSADYRGGNNNAAWDLQANTLLQKPATAISLTNFRTFARNRGSRWNALAYPLYHSMRWLYLVEYANRNSQLAVNNTPTVEGYKQGGLGPGVTDVNGTNWNTFSSSNPIVRIGNSVVLGNKSGSVNFTVSGFTGGDIVVPVNSYRGVELPFGHIWEFVDGVLFNIQANDSGAQSQIFICDNAANYADTVTGNFRQLGLLPRADGYISKVVLNEGCILPSSSSGGSSTTSFSDYFYTSIPASGSSVRALLSGGTAYHGAAAGLFHAYSNYAPSNTAAHVGSRLCFL